MENPQSSSQQGSAVASFPPGLWTAAYLLCPHTVDRETQGLFLFLQEYRFYQSRDATVWPHLTFTSSFKTQSPIHVHGGVCFNIQVLGEYNLVHSRNISPWGNFTFLWALRMVPFNLLGQFFPLSGVVSSHLKTDQNSNEDSLQSPEASLCASLCFPALSVVNPSSLLLPTLFIPFSHLGETMELSLESSSPHHS